MSAVMEEMTWREVRNRVAKCDVVMIPIGSTEQHGLHLPVKTDLFIAEQIALRAAEALSNDEVYVTVAPRIPFGTSSEHRMFPGTISVRPEIQVNLLKDVCTSLVHHGFNKIIIVNGHGGNVALTTALVEVWRETNAFVAVVSWWDLAQPAIKALIETEPDHADELETSMMLALDVPVRKEFVKAEKAVSPSKLYRYSAFSQSITVSDGWKLFSLSKSGANGDPTKASRGKGEKILVEAVKGLAELARELHEGKILPDPPVRKPERTKRRA